MKLTELTCKACGGTLKVDESNPNVAECEYCHTRYTLEDNGETTGRQPQFQYTAVKPPEKPRIDGKAAAGKRMAVLAVLLVAVLGILCGPKLFGGRDGDSFANLEQAVAAARGENQTDQTADPADAAAAAMEKLKEDALLAAFCQAVFDRPVEEVTGAELSQIRQLSISSTIELRKIGYSFADPAEEPEAELVWETFSRDTYPEADMSCLPAFSGLVSLDTSQSLRAGDLAGLSIREISGYFGSLAEIEAVVEKPEALTAIETISSSFDLSGIEHFPELKKLAVKGELTDPKLLIQGASLESLALESTSLSMDFSVLGMLTGLKELSISSENLRDIGFVSKLPELASFRLSHGTMLSLDALKDCPSLKQLSVEMCDEIKDFSVVSSLAGLESLRLDLPYGCPEPDLSGLVQLKTLYLEGFQNMGFLRNMSGLETLTLDSCQISDPSVFSSLGSLKSLTCTSFVTTERDYSFISGISSLEEVNLSGTATYDDISGIFNLPALKRLDISGMSAEINFDKVQENTVLEELHADHLKLYENVNVSGGGGIVYVDWDDVIFSEHLEFLGRLKNLKHLSIRENELTDLAFAQALGALETIDFSDNYVTDVSPLSALQNLKQATGTDNPVSNYEALGPSVTVVR